LKKLKTKTEINTWHWL